MEKICLKSASGGGVTGSVPRDRAALVLRQCDHGRQVAGSSVPGSANKSTNHWRLIHRKSRNTSEEGARQDSGESERIEELRKVVNKGQEEGNDFSMLFPLTPAKAIEGSLR